MNVLADREVVELLHDEPELLAVADAIAATQRRRRVVPFVAVPGVAAAVAAAVALLLVAPWQAPSLVDRALAAVGGGPVLHAVVEYSWPQDVVVDLATGAERERVHRYEYWYDEQREELLVRSSVDGGAEIDSFGQGEGARLDPALAGFATRYREALDAGRVEVDGDRMVFAPREGGAVEEVVVDPKTGAPLRFYETYPGGRRSPEWRVVTIESVPRDPGVFREPAGPREVAGEVSEARAVSLPEARRALGGAIVTLPGRSPTSVELSDTKLYLSDGRSFDGVLAKLDYGDVRLYLEPDALRAVARHDEESFPTPPAGSVVLRGSDREGWETQLVEGKLAVRIVGREKSQVLAAARELASQGP